MQQFDNYERLNPINIKITFNSIITDLARYQNLKYCFWIDDILFSSAITNDANVIFISCNGLNDATTSLINAKLYKTFGVINLTQFKRWNLVKGKSKWINAVIIDSEYLSDVDYFDSVFNTKN